jgi:dihydrofolate synthase/folylpolyglutamate synthase
VDIAIIETGLGGRLDSTNVITPILSVITNISYDHKDLLGNTLAEIATEKAGIMKKGVPCVIGEQHDETERVFFEQSVHRQSTLYYAQSLWGMVRTKQDSRYQYYKAVNNARREMFDIRTDLLGNYQQHNLKTILTVAELLSYKGFNTSIPTCIEALSNVKGLTGLRGRWEWLQEQPPVVCDVAHNPAGLREVLQQFDNLFSSGPVRVPSFAKKRIVIGFVRDKDISEALSLFPKDAVYYFCNAQLQRALPAQDLKELAVVAGLSGEVYDTVVHAVDAARHEMHDGDALLITGSFFIAGEALGVFERTAAQQA